MLDFGTLRKVNVKRCVEDFGHELDGWSVGEWAAATAGECGEACNVAKKLLRVRDGIINTDGMSKMDYVKALGDEIADMVLYADLWAASQGIDLGEAIRQKFNKVSAKRKSNIILP